MFEQKHPIFSFLKTSKYERQVM